MRLIHNTTVTIMPKGLCHTQIRNKKVPATSGAIRSSIKSAVMSMLNTCTNVPNMLPFWTSSVLSADCNEETFLIKDVHRTKMEGSGEEHEDSC